MLDSAEDLRDLDPPGNRLEKLRGDRRGQRSIRINDQWRVCFAWDDRDAFQVEIVDYHCAKLSRTRSHGTMPTGKKIPPVHPGKILKEEFIEAYALSQNEVAQAIGVDTARINKIVNEQRSVTADTAIRLAQYFDTTPGFWMNLQRQYDLQTAEAEHGEQIRREVQPMEV